MLKPARVFAGKTTCFLRRYLTTSEILAISQDILNSNILLHLKLPALAHSRGMSILKRIISFRQAKENRVPSSRRPSPFGGGAPSPVFRGGVPSPASTERKKRISPAGSGRPQYSNSFAQVLGSRITPPPPIFQVSCVAVVVTVL